MSKVKIEAVWFELKAGSVHVNHDSKTNHEQVTASFPIGIKLTKDHTLISAKIKKELHNALDVAIKNVNQNLKTLNNEATTTHKAEIVRMKQDKQDGQ